MTKKVYCEKCVKEIKFRDDLVTAVLFLKVVPYHSDCYAKDLKSAKTFFLDNKPLNGFSGNLGFVLALILAIGWSLISAGLSKWWSLLVIIAIGYRLYSYIMFERHVEK
ncbi:hypothetical protein [Falsibacillus pallidus]|uniref:hypothetical protein n=1 Tax=Falsibacillus pallidus TaxID=493781 RepID=UPI003D98C77C